MFAADLAERTMGPLLPCLGIRLGIGEIRQFGVRDGAREQAA